MGSQRNVGAYKRVKERSGGVCEKCQAARATSVHHRRLRSAGGADSLLNLTHVCSSCHTHIHAHPAESYESGWLISPKVHGWEMARMFEVED